MILGGGITGLHSSCSCDVGLNHTSKQDFFVEYIFKMCIIESDKH